MLNFVGMVVFSVVYSPSLRCSSWLRIGGTCTNSIYYTTSLSMSINVNKRMCRAFAKVMYFTVVACKLHSLRLLASLNEKRNAPRSSIAPLSNVRNHVVRIFFYTLCPCASFTFTRHSYQCMLAANIHCLLLSWTSAVENTCFSYLAQDRDGEYQLLLPITFILSFLM